MYSATISQTRDFKYSSNAIVFERTVSSETIVMNWLSSVTIFCEKVLGYIGKTTILLVYCIALPFIIMPILWLALWLSNKSVKKSIAVMMENLPFMEHRDVIEAHLVIERHVKQLQELKISTIHFSSSLSHTLFQPFLQQINKYHESLSETERKLFAASYPEYDIEYSELELRTLAEAYKHINLEDLD